MYDGVLNTSLTFSFPKENFQGKLHFLCTFLNPFYSNSLFLDIKKPLVSSCFQGVEKNTRGRK